MLPRPSVTAQICSRADHDALTANERAFRGGTRFTFVFFGVDEAGRDEERQAANCTRCGSTISIAVAKLARRDTAYEHAARLRKVLKLLGLVPPGETAEANARAAALMASWSTEQRDAFAREADCRRPGFETWRLFCEAVRDRAPVAPAAEVRS